MHCMSHIFGQWFHVMLCQDFIYVLRSTLAQILAAFFLPDIITCTFKELWIPSLFIVLQCVLTINVLPVRPDFINDI